MLGFMGSERVGCDFKVTELKYQYNQLDPFSFRIVSMFIFSSVFVLIKSS